MERKADLTALTQKNAPGRTGIAPGGLFYVRTRARGWLCLLTLTAVKPIADYLNKEPRFDGNQQI